MLTRFLFRFAARLAPVFLLLVLLPAPAAAEDPIGEWPLSPEPEVAADFDPPSNPYGAGHRGVDLRGTAGQRVRAALPGVITFAGPLAGRGVVVVDHGATRTTYEPVQAGTAVGEQVEAGQVIGTLQVPGSHCFPRACLHWGWREGDTYLDPLLIVGAGPVRLLPLWRDSPITSTGPSGQVAASVPASALGSGAGVGLLVGAP